MGLPSFSGAVGVTETLGRDSSDLFPSHWSGFPHDIYFAGNCVTWKDGLLEGPGELGREAAELRVDSLT